MGNTQSVSIVKHAVVALLAVYILVIVLRVTLSLRGMAPTIGISLGVLILVTLWFIISVGRVPTPQERSRFMLLYGGLLVFIFLS